MHWAITWEEEAVFLDVKVSKCKRFLISRYGRTVMTYCLIKNKVQ